MHSGSQRGAESNAWQAMFLLFIWEQSDALCVIRHGNNVLIVHHEASCSIAAQVDVDEEVIVASTKKTCEDRQNKLDVCPVTFTCFFIMFSTIAHINSSYVYCFMDYLRCQGQKIK